MKSSVFTGLSLAAVAGLHYSNLFTRLNVTHPAWHQNALLFGSLGGALLSLLVLWLCAAKPRLGRWVSWVVWLGFVGSLMLTLYFANIFIAADSFDPVAVNIWHKGSYLTVITFVPSLAILVSKLRIIGKFVGK